MIPSTRRIVPGMLASLLLATPLLASPAQADGRVFTDPGQKAARQKPARPGHLVRRRTLPATPAATVAYFDDATPGWSHRTWQQTGIASWYGGPRWQGQQTASGARYEQDGLTAAHATLPLGSRVRVALDGTDRSVIVTINDRPGTHSRIIDLSRGAASALGIIDRGIARVTLSAP